MKAISSRSFTLVELMAAMAVLSLLMVAMVAMFDQAMRGWRNAQKGIDGRREVRAALQLIERDLRGMVVGTNAPFFTEGSGGADKGQMARIYFMTTLPDYAQDQRQGGDLCGVGYYLQWSNQLNERRGAYVLMRYQMEASTLMQRLTNLSSSISNTTRTALFPDSPGRDERITNEILAMNVTHLQIEPFAWNKANNNWDYENVGEFLGGQGNNFVVRYTNRPGFFAVNLGAYDPATIRAFTNQTDWIKESNVRKHLRTYFWRVVP